MNRLKELRSEANLSLRQLQYYVGIDFSRLAIIEKNDSNIESKTLEKLLVFFKVNYSYFYGGDGIIDFYNDDTKTFYPLAYYQFKDILNKYKPKVFVEDNVVKRVLPKDCIELINNYFDCQSKSLDIELFATNIIDKMEKLNEFDFNKVKDRLIDYFETKK